MGENEKTKLRLKAKGETETFDLGEISGVEVLEGASITFRHEGAGLVNAWARRLQAVKLAEVRRINDLFREFGDEAMQAAFGDEQRALEAARLTRVEAIEKAGQVVPERLSEPVPLRMAVSTPEGSAAIVDCQRQAVADCVVSLDLPGQSLTDPEQIAEECIRLGVLGSCYVKANEVQRISAVQFPSAEGLGSDGLGGDPVAERGAAVD